MDDGQRLGDVGALLADAIRHHQAGRLSHAEALYRHVLAHDPDHADGLHLLGVIAYQVGRLEPALELISQAISRRPGAAPFHSNLANVWKDLGQMDQAVASYRRALELDPGLPDAHSNLGNALKDLGALDEAIAEYRAAIRLRPDFAEAHNNLGQAFLEKGEIEAAIASTSEAVALRPNYATALANLGIALTRQGRPAEALEVIVRALALTPEDVTALCAQAAALVDLGRHQEAAAAALKALAIKPNDPPALLNLSGALQRQGLAAEAEAVCRQAILAKPDYAKAHTNLGNALKDQNRLDEAVAAYRQAIALAPDSAESHNNLGNALKDLGALEDAVATYRRAIALKPDFRSAHSNLLFTLNYMARITPTQALEEARQYGRLASAAATPFTRWECPPTPERLRVGLVSGDLRGHPVGHFLDGVVAALDPSRVELLAYPTGTKADALTERLRPHFAGWNCLAGLGDREAAARIHADGLHVLIDLSGHTAHNRLPVFAWRPAPVQVTWLGYFATTGMSEIDAILADCHMVPPEEEAHFTERVWHLPETHWCFTPPAEAGEVAPLPALASGIVTFGCFNNLTKINDGVVALWARVLGAVPGSRLLLKARQLAQDATRRAILDRLKAHGIAAERLLLEGPSPRGAMLADYGRVDIALDPFPFPGGTTSVEGLWMGVPVLTRRGDRFVAHQGECIAHNAGLADWIAADDDDYVAKAVTHAADLARLAALRHGLRQQLAASPLFDAPRFARHLEAALWGLWLRTRS